MSAIRIFLLMLLALCSGIANAELPVKTAPQVGFYLTKHFGSQQPMPVEMGARFHYGEVGANIYQREARSYRPALFDIKFNRNGLTAFETAGVNVLQPRYMLGAEEGGFFSNINWPLVGMAVVTTGIFIAAEDDRDDREDQIDELEQDTQDGSAPDSDSGGGSGGGPTGTPLDDILGTLGL